MSEERRVPAWIGTTLVCAVIGLASFYGTQWLLGEGVIGFGDAPDISFDAAVLEEEDDYRADLHAAAQTIEQRWSYLEYRVENNGFDLEARLNEALQLLGESPDELAFARALTYLVAGLDDGHAFAMPAEWRSLHPNRLPCSLVEVSDGIMVDASTDDQLQRGDLLISINDTAIEDWIARAEDYVFASTDPSRRAFAIELVASSMLDEDQASVQIEQQDGTVKEIQVTCPRSYTQIDSPSERSNTREHRMLPGEIAYFRPGKFTAPPDSGWSDAAPSERDAILADTYQEFDDIMGSFKGARALVLDLRSNPGGTDLVGQFLVDSLVEGDYIYYQLSSLRGDGWSKFSQNRSSAPPSENKLLVPLAVLVDTHTFSTADNVAAALEDVHPDVIFVGRPNGAGTGAPRGFDLPRTGSTIYFCTQRVKTPSGRYGEGISVRLDAEVVPSRADLLNDRDPVLQRALQLLAE